MKMSVYRQRKPLEQIEHIQLMRKAVGSQAAEMIVHARLHHATVLVGMEGGQAIIKPADDGDEHSCFEDLYDSAITGHDFSRMREQKVTSREELALQLFHVELLMRPSDYVRVHVQLKAKGDYEVADRLQRLFREDTEFGKELRQRFTHALLQPGMNEIEHCGALRIKSAAPADAPEWRFVSEDEEEDAEDEDA